MKLLNKISYYYIINTAVLFVFGLIAIYLSVNWIIDKKARGQLKDTSKEVALKIQQGIINEYPPLVEIKELNEVIPVKPVFSDTTIYLASEKENEVYRQYKVCKKIGDKYYRIIVRTSLIEKNDLFSAILTILGIILITLLAILFIINRLTARKIFKPFYLNLNKLKMFSLHNNKSLGLDKTDIKEFNELNNALDELSEKAIKEYQSIKEFSEDLSHELQTPVAVIKAKAELLQQEEFEDEETTNNLQSIINNAIKLDKLNKSLVLMSKLESKDFFPSQKILLKARAEKIIENFIDIAQSKNLKLIINLESNSEIYFNDNLFDIMISNLISNAIKHNLNSGEIIIELNNSILSIKNTGKEPKQEPLYYFKRFSYDEKSPNSLGLGLAIIKKICDLHGISIQYLFKNQYHIFIINFGPVLINNSNA